VVGTKRSPRRPKQRPDQILDAAEDMLADGTADLNMDRLAEAAGLGKGTLYHYYASKTEVLDALRRRYLERATDKALAAASTGTTRQRYAAFIETLLDDAATNGALVWVLFHDTGIVGNTHLVVVSDALRELIRDGVIRGDLAIDNPDAVASFFAHGFFGRVQTAFDGAGAVRPGDLAAELTVMLERLVTPVERPR
jgi:AcrR family transcriptional regulator